MFSKRSVCVCVWAAQSCLILCNPMDCSSPGSSVHEILHARILEWVVIHFSRGSSQPRDRTQVSGVVGRFFTLWETRNAPKIFASSSLNEWVNQERHVDKEFNFRGTVSLLLPWVKTECSWCVLLNEHLSLVAQLVKNLPAGQWTWVQSLGWEDLLEKEMANYSSILAWKTPWTEAPDGL